MNGEYKIFKRSPSSGLKSVLIQRYKSFTLNLNWGTQSKFSIKGETVGTPELESGDYILFYRNNELIFTGVVEELSITCENPMYERKEWTATGEDDNVIFKHRLVVPDPDNMTFLDKITDKINDYAHKRIVHYINRNMGSEASSARRISGLNVPSGQSIGKNTQSSYRYKTLSDVISEIGSEDNNGNENGLYPIYDWNPDTGTKTIRIPEQRNKKNSVILSPEYGNVVSWSKTTKMPKFNALWICSGTYTDKNATEVNGVKPTTRIWQYHADADSISKYGRIEKLITKSDVKVVYNDPKTSEDESVTADQVNIILTNEAVKQLRDNAFRTKYTISMAETPFLQFWTDWKCGDLVTCVIDGNKFTATIKSVTITYSKGKETVKPTVGSVEQGEFAELFTRIYGIDTRLEDKEMEG